LLYLGLFAPILCPAFRKQPGKLAGFHVIDAGVYVREIFDWVKPISFGGCYERQVYSQGFSTGIGPTEKKIFSTEHERFYFPLGGVVMCALSRCTGSMGNKSHPATLAPAGNTRSGSGGDKWSEAHREKRPSGVQWAMRAAA